MVDSNALVMDWGNLSLATRKIGSLSVALDNAIDAFNHADFSGKRLSFLEDIHKLTNAPCDIFEVFPGITSQATYNAELALRASAPIIVFHVVILDEINGGDHTYYFAEQIVTDVETLFQNPLFTGVINTWRHSLNIFTLEITSTEKSDDKQIPEKLVTFNVWPIARKEEGKPYPEVWGTLGINFNDIDDGFGASPCIAVDPSTLKYIVSGHAMTSVGISPTTPITVWARIQGYKEGYAYIEGATFNLSDTDTEGNTITTVTLPRVVLARLFLPSLVEGDYFVNTAANPDNATGRDKTIVATLASGERLQLAVSVGPEAGDSVIRVYIATNVFHASAITGRWSGPQSQTIAGGTSSGPRIDSIAGWDLTGLVEISGSVHTYTGITDISLNVFQLDVSAYGGPTGGGLDATMVGASVTITTSLTEITTQRDWTKSDFYKFELSLDSSAGSFDVEYLGFLIEIELGGVPEILVDGEGVNVTYKSTDYGASRNPALIIEDIHTRLLGLPESRIGDTIDDNIPILAGWKLDIPVWKQEDVDRVLKRIADQARLWFWRDGSDNIQIGLFRLTSVSTVTIPQSSMIDAEGDGFQIAWTDTDDIVNQLVLFWRPDHGAGGGVEGFSKKYFIDESDSFPTDAAREGQAILSQADYNITKKLVIEASYIQDESTALELLQVMFDFWRIRRRRLKFSIPMHIVVRPGQVALITHDLLSQSFSYLIEETVRQGSVQEITALELAIATLESVDAEWSVTGQYSIDNRWGSPEYWDAWDDVNVASQSAVTGLITSFGLKALAVRQADDSGAKITHGAFGSGSGGLSGGDANLGSQNGARQTLIETIQAPTTQLKFGLLRFSSTTIREIGLFGGASGSNLWARTVFAGDVNVPSGAFLSHQLNMTLEVHASSLNHTTLGITAFSNRLTDEVSVFPAFLAIGTGTTPFVVGDTTLDIQSGVRRAMVLGWPIVADKTVQYSAFFAGFGPITITEIGLFQTLSSGTCLLRIVLATAITIAATEDINIVLQITDKDT